jgi:bifunctional non-homologous end joining protein LigD
MSTRRSPGGTSPVPAYKPQLARLVKDPPEGDEWIHEMKYEGYRIGCRIVDGMVSLVDRNGKLWTEAFPEICDAARQLGVRQALLDGEVAIVLPDGRTSFPDLQNALNGGSRRGLVYFVFDLLHVAGETLIHQPLIERKAALLRLVGKPRARSRIRYSEHFAGPGSRMFYEACRLRLGGVVSKRRDGKYKSGRGAGWVTTRCASPEAAAIDDAARPERTRKPRGEPDRSAASQVAAGQMRRAAGPRAVTDSAGANRRDRVDVAGVSISHPDRVMFPQPQFTKLDIARFYERIADWIVPHLEGRPLTLVRCPDGTSGECFFMKHSKVWAPPALRRASIQEKTKVGQYLIADSVSGVVSLVQMDVLEFHTWNTRIDNVECPDRIVFDIDPGAQVPWRQVIESARLVREVLRTAGLESFPKTTGGKGLHVVVPLNAEADWRACLDFSRAVAAAIERHAPDTYTTAFAKTGRERKILIDYLRNNRTNTSVAAFSARARDGAPVSMPLRWEDVNVSLDPAAWTLATVERRLSSLRRDPWRDYWTTRQRLPRDAGRALARIR